MIRKDFIEGGFPISRRSPVICINGNKVDLCYNRFDLHALLKDSGAKWGSSNFIQCIGIWPGKKTTDGFTLNPTAYMTPTPPEEHKDIDSAQSITVMFYRDASFSSIIYTPGLFSEDQTPVASKDKALYEYAKNVGLKFRSIIEGEEKV